MSRRPRDRDDRRLRVRALAAAGAVTGLVVWYGYSLLVDQRIPLRRGRDVSFADDPVLFGWLTTLLIAVPLISLMGVIAWVAVTRGRENAGLNRRLSLPLDKAVRTSYEAVVTPPRPLIIAVDGPAASGKGTVAARLADHYGLPFLDTGLLYRAVGLAVLDAGASPDDAAIAEAAARRIDLSALTDVERLTGRGAGEAASRVASHAAVRAVLFDVQRAFAAQAGGAVLDGRDIGTVIAPDAPAKLFVTATPEVRARRRWTQLTARGEVIAYDDMLADILRRDARDAGRGSAPMVQAPDAVLLDTSEMDIDAAFDAARRIVETARARQG